MKKQIVLRIILIFPFICWIVPYCCSQNNVNQDSTDQHRNIVATISEQDTSFMIQDTARVQQIKKRLSKKKWTSALYQSIVSEPKSAKKDDHSIDLAYQAYKGKKIDSLRIIVLTPFGTNVKDPDAFDPNWWERSGNKLHVNTRKKLIEKNLFFKKNDLINPLEFSENEVFLRDIDYIHDVRIVIDTVGMADNGARVTVIVRDKFPVAFSVRSLTEHSVGLEVYNKNLLQTGTELYLSGLYDNSYDRKWGYGVRGKYNNLAKTFINVEGSYSDQITEKIISVSAERPLKIVLKNYGQISYDQAERRLNVFPWDSASPPYYNVFSSTLGHLFSFNKNDLHFSVAVRYLKYHASFSKVNMNPDPLLYDYASRQTLLAQISLFRQHYYRQSMVRDFGVAENIAHGFDIVGQIGYNLIPNYYEGMYMSLDVSAGKQFPFFNFYFRGGVGSHLDDGTFTNGIFSTDIHLFTPLFNMGATRFRQFFNVNYVLPIKQDQRLPDYLYFNSLAELNTTELKGTSRLIFNAESDFFTPLNIFGFRMVFFAFFDGGWITLNRKLVTNDNFYWGAGLGIRLRNDLLVFKTLSLKFGFYPRLQSGFNDFFEISTSDPDLMPNFYPNLPEIIRVQ